MAPSRRKKELTDDQKRIVVSVFPYTGHSVCTIGIGYRDAAGVHDHRLAYWHLRLTRGDLAGHTVDDVLRALVGALVRHLDDGGDPADKYATAGGPGAPLGATGGTVTQDPLPGLSPTLQAGQCLDTDGGIAPL